MIILMKPNATQDDIEKIVEFLDKNGLKPHLSVGEQVSLIGIIGDKTQVLYKNLELFNGVNKLINISENNTQTNKKKLQDRIIVEIGDLKIGGNELAIMAGPCAIESEQQILQTAHYVKNAGAQIFRGGAYKPRTSPHSFQGLEEEGLKFLQRAKNETGLAVVCEVTSRQVIDVVIKYADILQIGARNMQNFDLLKAAGQTKLPILLKRGVSATIHEWLNAAEYIFAEGNEKIILCERGIRTYETSTRNTLDISAVPVIKSQSPFPIIVDPSHSSGNSSYVPSLSKAAIAAGTDGLLIETHPCPQNALSDGAQSLNPAEFENLCGELKILASAVGRTFQ